MFTTVEYGTCHCLVPPSVYEEEGNFVKLECLAKWGLVSEIAQDGSVATRGVQSP
jgi:hypothetical protein